MNTGMKSSFRLLRRSGASNLGCLRHRRAQAGLSAPSHARQATHQRTRANLRATGTDSEKDLQVIDKQLEMQLERLRVAEKENADLKKQIDELERELDIDFEMLSMSEETVITGPGPSLPQLDEDRNLVYDAIEVEEEEGVKEEETEAAGAAQVPEDSAAAVEMAEEEEEEVTSFITHGDKVISPDVEEEDAVPEPEPEPVQAAAPAADQQSAAVSAITSLPGVGDLWSAVPKATLRVGKAGVTEEVVQNLVAQLAESESGLVKVQLFNKHLETLGVANDILSLCADTGVVLAESKGRTLLFKK